MFHKGASAKLKLAANHNMLNHIGSSIDDVEMDQASFFRLYHSLRGEDGLFFNRFLTLNPDHGAFLEFLSRDGLTAIGA